VPDIRWRLAASAVRAMHVLESTAQHGITLDWLGQIACAGYGPVGIHNCFSEIIREGWIKKDVVPRFAVFQQDANAAMVHAWQDQSREIGERHVVPQADQYLEPGLYNVNPGRNYTRLFDLLTYFGGGLFAVTAADCERYEPLVLAALERVGIRLARNAAGQLLERAGVLTGVGILKAIDAGHIAKGSRVGYFLTGGMRPAGRRAAIPTPHARIDDTRSEAEWIDRLGQVFALSPAAGRMSDALFPRRSEG
jgi:hypothetical protein